MKLGFTGTREAWTSNQEESVKKEIFLISECDELGLEEFHHGDCVGSDEAAHHEVHYEYPGCYIVVHPPSNPILQAGCEGNQRKDPKPYLVRNLNILRESDYLLATPKENRLMPARGSGTWSTIRKAFKLKMPISIVFVDGSICRFNEEETNE